MHSDIFKFKLTYISYARQTRSGTALPFRGVLADYFSEIFFFDNIVWDYERTMLCCALHCIAEESRDYTLLIMCCRQSKGSQGSLYRQVRFFKPAVKITETYSQ